MIAGQMAALVLAGSASAATASSLSTQRQLSVARCLRIIGQPDSSKGFVYGGGEMMVDFLSDDQLTGYVPIDPGQDVPVFAALWVDDSTVSATNPHAGVEPEIIDLTVAAHATGRRLVVRRPKARAVKPSYTLQLDETF